MMVFPELSPDAPDAAMLPDGGTGGGRLHREGRSDLLVRRIATHEGGHAVCARWLGSTIELLTIKPSNGFSGRCVRRGTSLALLDMPQDPIDVVEVCGRLGPPCPGENRNELAA